MVTLLFDNLVGIRHKFGLAFVLENNWQKKKTWHVWCDIGTPPCWVEVGCKGRFTQVTRHPFWPPFEVVGC